MTIATLPARLTHEEAPSVTRQLANALSKTGSGHSGDGEPWAIDASALKHFDSSALAVLLECRRLAGASGRQVSITNPPAKLGQLARLYGLDELLLLSDAAAGEPAAATPQA